MKKLAVKNVHEFLYGTAPKPVKAGRGLVLGGGQVYPEINFTLPPIDINAGTWGEICEQYRTIISEVTDRAVELDVPGLLVEFETLPPMTMKPEWGLEITKILSERLKESFDKRGLKNALRLTINDIREFNRPPLLRRGKYWDSMVEFLDKAGSAGADMIAIESTGGKEVCDDALVMGELGTMVFAMGVLASRDIAFLWKNIVQRCQQQGIVASGDTACGFANTAMVLAEKKMVPRVFAALVRAASVPRSLVAYEMGAKGPSKDCAYEGVYMKAIAGVPISMEGKSAACAHLSSVGNISQAVCDCWSNESTSNLRMLSVNCPVVSLEELAYDCRLMNTAGAEGHDSIRKLRDWLVDSDAGRDPQAYILRPDVVLEISEKLMAKETAYERTVAAVAAAHDAIKRGHAAGRLKLAAGELRWMERMEGEIASLPKTEGQMIELVMGREDMAGKFRPEEYEIGQKAGKVLPFPKAKDILDASLAQPSCVLKRS
jgi:methanol---5-hydroxybenzimidazolylcobamide Co-methyltransferase